MGDRLSNIVNVIPVDPYLNVRTSLSSGYNAVEYRRPTASIYRPEHLIFYPVKPGAFSDIQFRITQPNGTAMGLELPPAIANKDGGTCLTLIFRPTSPSHVGYSHRYLSKANVSSSANADEDDFEGWE